MQRIIQCYALTALLLVVLCIQISHAQQMDVQPGEYKRQTQEESSHGLRVLHIHLSPADPVIDTTVKQTIQDLSVDGIDLRTLSVAGLSHEQFYREVAELSKDVSFVIIEGHGAYTYVHPLGSSFDNFEKFFRFINDDPDNPKNPDLKNLTKAPTERQLDPEKSREAFQRCQPVLYDPDRILAAIPSTTPIFIDACYGGVVARGQRNIASACAHDEISYEDNPVRSFVVGMLTMVAKDSGRLREFDRNKDGKFAGEEWYTLMSNTHRFMFSYEEHLTDPPFTQGKMSQELRMLIEEKAKANPPYSYVGTRSSTFWTYEKTGVATIVDGEMKTTDKLMGEEVHSLIKDYLSENDAVGEEKHERIWAQLFKLQGQPFTSENEEKVNELVSELDKLFAAMPKIIYPRDLGEEGSWYWELGSYGLKIQQKTNWSAKFSRPVYVTKTFSPSNPRYGPVTQHPQFWNLSFELPTAGRENK